MNSKSIVFGLATVVLSSIAIATEAQAAKITGLYSTGVDNNGVARTANNTLNDLHYSLISSPNSVNDTRIIPPPGSWLANTSASAWIGPVGGGLSGPTGTYVYRTTFDLAGLDPSTASISGRWSTDNNGLQILLNGVNTGVPATSFTQFSSFAPFTISSGFQAGSNTLDFYVNNGGGPTGLRVELGGTANSTTAVPEPFTIVGTIIGGTAALRLRKKLKSATIG